MALKNWNYANYEAFLLACGYTLEAGLFRGSPRQFISPDGDFKVELHYHSKSEVIRSPNMAMIIVKNSGIPEKFWSKVKKDLRNIKKNRDEFWKEVDKSRKESGMS